MTAPEVSTAARTPAPARPHFAALDGLRAIAALAVVATHTGFASGRSIDDGPFAPLLARLDFGVTLFFLLSGFVIYRPFAAAALTGRPAPATGRFYLRRASRILPAYWVTVLLTLAVLTVRPVRPGDWISYLLLAQNYDGHDADPNLTQMWTLSVELMFYLLVPLLARAAGSGTGVRGQLRVVGGLFAVALAGQLVGNLGATPGRTSLLWLPANLDWFALGMLLAMVSAAGGFGVLAELARARGTCWLLAALVFWFATLPVAGPRSLLVPGTWEWFFKHYLYGSCALLILLPLTLAPGGRAYSVLAGRPMRDLGLISYGIYLWHLPLLLSLQRWLGYRTFGGHFWLLLGLTVASAVALASVSWHLVEKPALRWSARSYRPPGGVASSGAGPSGAGRSVEPFRS